MDRYITEAWLDENGVLCLLLVQPHPLGIDSRVVSG
jgi:hypothetical protein